jgi:hypothetical protein
LCLKNEKRTFFAGFAPEEDPGTWLRAFDPARAEEETLPEPRELPEPPFELTREETELEEPPE